MSIKANKYQKLNDTIRKLGHAVNNFENIVNKMSEANFENQEEYTPYQLLGINENSTIHEVKTAFRMLVLKYHPDKNSLHGNNAKMKKIINAYREVSRKQSKKYLKTEVTYE